MLVLEPDEIGNVIEEVVDHAGKRNLEVDSDDAQELLDSHNQELTIDELIEMHEQDIQELESLDPVQSEDRMTVGVINSLFTFKAFIPLERLCYLAYMLHVPLMYYEGGVQRERMFMGHYNQIMCFLSYTFMSFVLAFVCYLLFQVPFAAVEGLIFNKNHGNIWGANPMTVSQATLKNNDEEQVSIDEESKFSAKSKVLVSRIEETERF
ncbi:nose resistant to fluoxetine protein 6 [Trichonephila clavipes]|nr:nose resistant to fluoxetine protein 6 [Trichonephila clavipes]